MLAVEALVQTRSQGPGRWRQPAPGPRLLGIVENRIVWAEGKSIVLHKGTGCDAMPGLAVPTISAYRLRIQERPVATYNLT